MVTHAYNSSTGEVEAGKSYVFSTKANFSSDSFNIRFVEYKDAESGDRKNQLSFFVKEHLQNGQAARHGGSYL
jgi:hypothetical protein